MTSSLVTPSRGDSNEPLNLFLHNANATKTKQRASSLLSEQTQNMLVSLVGAGEQIT